MTLTPRISSDGKLETVDRGWRLWIPQGPGNRYRLSQLDDHQGLSRSKYPVRAPMRMRLDARASARALPGTWGFGLWNDPYGFSFGPGNGFLRLPTLPNAAWFFFSSPTSHLSFRDDRPANGFLAQVFSSPKFSPRLFEAALSLPFSLRRTRSLLAEVIREDSARLDEDHSAAGIDVTSWHNYSMEWTAERTLFYVDERPILDTPLSPRGPLGIVIWIDNQHAGFHPQGKVTFGLEPNREPAYIEVRDLAIE